MCRSDHTASHAAGPAISRREALAGAATLVATVGATTLAAPAPVWSRPAVPVADDLDVYVVVTDGMRPDELNPAQAPTLSRWAGEGTRYTNASSIMIAETLPNHAAMVTGVLPEVNGIPANSVFDPSLGRERTLDRPEDLLAPTVLERIRVEAGLTTASVLSKDYLHGLFGGRASVQWAPFPLLPVTKHSLDHFTIEALQVTVNDHAPRMTFVNLGDMDRFGHMDLSGTSLRLARNQAVANSDHSLWRFERFLRSSGRWDRSVLIVLADHGMDWSEPQRLITVTEVLNRDPALRGRFGVAQNGGAEAFTYLGPAAERDASLERLRAVVSALPGVNRCYAGADLNLGPRGGDLVATCHPGWRFSDPTFYSNPIPGNHGHEVTLGIPFLVSGGHRIVRRGQVVDRPVRTPDVAPTVAWLFGLNHSGMSGTPVREAFAL